MSGNHSQRAHLKRKIEPTIEKMREQTRLARKERNRLAAQRSRDRESQKFAAHQVLQAWAEAQGFSLPSEPVLAVREMPDFSEISDIAERRRARNAFSAAKGRDAKSAYLEFFEQFKTSLIEKIGKESLESTWQIISQHVLKLDILAQAPIRTPLNHEQMILVLSKINSKASDDGVLKTSSSPASSSAAPVVLPVVVLVNAGSPHSAIPSPDFGTATRAASAAIPEDWWAQEDLGLAFGSAVSSAAVSSAASRSTALLFGGEGVLGLDESFPFGDDDDLNFTIDDDFFR